MTVPAKDFDPQKCPSGLLKVTVRTVRHIPIPHLPKETCKVPFTSTPPDFEIEVLNRTGYDVELTGDARVTQGAQWIGIAPTPGDTAAGFVAKRDLFGRPGRIVPDQQGLKPPLVVMKSIVAAIQDPATVQQCQLSATLDVAIGYFNYSEAGRAILELDAEP